MLQDNGLQIYIRSMGSHPLLSVKEEQQLAKRAQKGEAKAISLLISRNLKLVIKIAKDFNYGSVELLDLISDGNIGLQKAAEKFRPGMNSKFSTYAIWWIKQTILRSSSNHSRQIRIPVHMLATHSKIHRIKQQLEVELGREATNEEVAEVTGLSAKRVKFITDAMVSTVSLQTPVGVSDDGIAGQTQLGDLLQDTATESTYEQIQKKAVVEIVQSLLDTLTPKERNIIERRFGLNGNIHATLEKVADEYDVTRERVRQIQEKTLRKLRIKLNKLHGVPNGRK